MITDPVADFLTRIRNASLSNKESLRTTYSSMRYAIAQILKKEGYIANIQIDDTDPIKKELVVTLAYSKIAGKQAESRIKRIKRISKPSRRMYVTHTSIPRPLRGMGTVIISTSNGVVSGKEAYKLGLGGEVICEIW